jgi:hypothetical protein
MKLRSQARPNKIYCETSGARFAGAIAAPVKAPAQLSTVPQRTEHAGLEPGEICGLDDGRCLDRQLMRASDILRFHKLSFPERP